MIWPFVWIVLFMLCSPAQAGADRPAQLAQLWQNPPRADAPRRRLPPAPRQQTENEYYAEDWIVYDQERNVLCNDPYIMLDLKVVRCIAPRPPFDPKRVKP